MFDKQIDAILKAREVTIQWTDNDLVCLYDKEHREIGTCIMLLSKTSCYLLWVGIYGDMQHTGFGSLLLYAVLQKANQLGLSSVTLSSLEMSENFYEKNGFVFENETKENGHMVFHFENNNSVEKIEAQVEKIEASYNPELSNKKKRRLIDFDDEEEDEEINRKRQKQTSEYTLEDFATLISFTEQEIDMFSTLTDVEKDASETTSIPLTLPMPATISTSNFAIYSHVVPSEMIVEQEVNNLEEGQGELPSCNIIQP